MLAFQDSGICLLGFLGLLQSPWRGCVGFCVSHFSILPVSFLVETPWSEGCVGNTDPFLSGTGRGFSPEEPWKDTAPGVEARGEPEHYPFCASSYPSELPREILSREPRTWRVFVFV